MGVNRSTTTTIHGNPVMVFTVVVIYLVVVVVVIVVVVVKVVVCGFSIVVIKTPSPYQ